MNGPPVRRRLPPRRRTVTCDIAWRGHPIAVSIGFDPDTLRPAEVFANTASGGDMQAALADACIVISLHLQHGHKLHDLRHSMGVAFDPMTGRDEPASPIGALVEALIREQERIEGMQAGMSYVVQARLVGARNLVVSLKQGALVLQCVALDPQGDHAAEVLRALAAGSVPDLALRIDAEFPFRDMAWDRSDGDTPRRIPLLQRMQSLVHAARIAAAQGAEVTA